MPLDPFNKGAKTDVMCFENEFKLLLGFIPYSHLPQQQTSQLCREVKSETGNCASHVDILGYKLMFRALYKTVLFSEFTYIALKHSFDLY